MVIGDKDSDHGCTPPFRLCLEDGHLENAFSSVCCRALDHGLRPVCPRVFGGFFCGNDSARESSRTGSAASAAAAPAAFAVFSQRAPGFAMRPPRGWDLR